MKRLVLILFITLASSLHAQDLLNNAQIHDYSVGDVFHHYIFLESADGNTEEKIETEIISKFYSTNEDTVFYGRARARDYSTSSTQWGNVQYSTDTIFIPFLNSEPNGIDTVYSNPDLYNGRIVNQRMDTTITETDISTKEWRYTEGLGETLYYFTSSSSMFSLFFIELVYYYKAETGEEWSTPLVLSTADIINLSEINLFPNPSNGLLNWNSPSGLGTPNATEVLDLTGRTVFVKSDEIHDNQLDLTNLPSGTYILKLKFKDGYLSKRIVLQDE